MLTTQVMRSETPVEGVVAKKAGESLPGAAPFSELFSSMFLDQTVTGEAGLQVSPTILDLQTSSEIMAQDIEGAAVLTDLSVFDGALPEIDSALSLLNGSLQDVGSMSMPKDADSNLQSVVNQLSSLAEFTVSKGSEAAVPVETLDKIVSEELVVPLADNSVQSVSLDEPLMTPFVAKSADAQTAQTKVGLPGVALDPVVESLGLDDVTVLSESTVASELSLSSTSREASVKTVVSNVSPEASLSNNEELPLEEVISESIDPILTQAQATIHQPIALGGQPNSSLHSSNVSSPVVATSWGGQVSDQQSASASAHQGQAFNQNGQGGQGQSNQQQAMMFAQAIQEHKQQAIEQQAAVKLADEAVSKSEGKELLGGAEFASSDRRSQLPLGLQTINLPVRHPQWGQALGQRVAFMANHNIQQAQITLNPEKLGRIQVTLQLDKDQQMHVSMTAQHGTTRESMESALPRLREMLEQSGINLASMSVSDQKQFSDGSSEQQSEARKDSLKNTLTEDETVVDSPLSIVKTTDNIVDYYA